MPIPATFHAESLLRQIIGGYELKEVLGKSNAVVYRAVRLNNGEDVAFKLLAWPGAEVDATALRRFKREIEILRGARHKAIIDIYDWHSSSDYVYLVMEHCEGTLEQWLRGRSQRLRLADILAIAEPLADALDYLHDGISPVLHRDIKPANILFKGRAWYVGDFGIARMEGDQSTSDGTWRGTPRYAAPEQITDGKLSAKTDIYCFGLVVYEMLTGSWVLGNRDARAAYEIPPLASYRRGLGPAVDELFAQWLAADPASRPARALDAVHELAARAGILRDPALSRLYDMAAELAARPRNPEAWRRAGNLLNVIALHEPSFSDPRGLAALLRTAQDGSRHDVALPEPSAGYTGNHPAPFYSDKTLALPGPPEAEAADTPPARKLRPPTEGGTLFAPRARADTDCTLVVPANSHWEGAVFGRNIIVEAGARVDGEVYSLGELTLGAGCEVNSVVAGSRLEVGPLSRITGNGGAQAGSIRLGMGTRLGGTVAAVGGLEAAPGIEAGGLLAKGPISLEGEARIGSASIASSDGLVEAATLVSLAGGYAGPESLHPWTPGAGQVLTSLLTLRGRALAEDALKATEQKAALSLPEVETVAGAPSLEAARPTAGQARYVPAALVADADAPPVGLPTEDWEGQLAGAWMLNRAWVEFLRGLRLPAACALLLTLLCWGGAAWLAGRAPQVSWGLILIWVGVMALAGGLVWALRPRPLEIVRLWWPWETWSIGGGVLVWDTLDPGSGPGGWAEPESPPAPLAEIAVRLSVSGAEDDELLAGLTDLHAALETMAWKNRPGVFAPNPDREVGEGAGPANAALELSRLDFKTEAAEAPADLLALPPRLGAGDVRAWAARLAAWPAYQSEAREVWRAIQANLTALDPALDRWEEAGEAAETRGEAAAATLAAIRERTAELAQEAVGLLEWEVGPDLDHLWELHVGGTKLLGEYYERTRHEQQATAKRDADRAAAHAAASTRELSRQEHALTEIWGELEPLAREWRDLGTAHERTGAELKRAWKEARARATQKERAGELSVLPRLMTLEQAFRILPQISQEAKILAAKGEELARERAKDDRELPEELTWPTWPQSPAMPIEVDEEALSGLLRRVADEPGRVRRASDKLNNLRIGVKHAWERAAGAAEALGEAARSSPPGQVAPQIVSAKQQADSLAAHLEVMAGELAALQYRLDRAMTAYREVADKMDTAIKGGRGPTWAQGRRYGQRYVELLAEQEAAERGVEEAREQLEAARQEQTRILAEAEATQEHTERAEQDLVAYSKTHAESEEADHRRPIEELRAGHQAVAASLVAHGERLAALTAFERDCVELKCRAAEELAERINDLTLLAEGRIDETAETRATALWPAGIWPAGDTLYLLPVWIMRYRPLGRRKNTRLMAVTPGTVRARPTAGRGIGGSIEMISGFEILPLPGLAARFEADMLTEINGGLSTDPLSGENLVPSLAESWKPLVERALVSRWLERLL